MSTGKKLFVEDLNTAGKRVIVRVDFNVPLKDGKVESDKRIKESLPTIAYLRKNGAKVILMSHLGRPDGKRVPDMSLRPVADALAALLGAPVAFAEDCVGPAAEQAVAALSPGGVLLLENLRFHAEEEENDPAFAKKLAALADLYVNDAFGSAHRAHASTEGITRFVPQAASGYLDEEGARLPGRGARRPEAAVRRRDRRLQGVEQDRRHQEPASARRQAADRRRHDLYLPQGAGAGGRQVDRRERQARSGAQPAGRGRAASWCWGPTSW